MRILKSGDWRDGAGMAFSADGRYVAYDRAANAASGQRDIHVIAVDGSGDTPAVAHPANDRVLGWSSDGRYLLFASDRSGSSGVWALPVREGTPQGEPELIRANVNPSPLGLTRSGALYYGLADGEAHIYVASADFETGKQCCRRRRSSPSPMSAWSAFLRGRRTESLSPIWREEMRIRGISRCRR